MWNKYFQLCLGIQFALSGNSICIILFSVNYNYSNLILYFCPMIKRPGMYCTKYGKGREGYRLELSEREDTNSAIGKISEMSEVKLSLQ